MVSLGLLVAIVLAGCTGDEAKRAKQAQEDAERAAKKALEDADRLTKEWQPKLVDAATEAKVEFDKVYPTTTEYDIVFAVPEEGSEKLRAHEARLAKMDRAQIHGVTVGYEQREDCSLGGKSFERHFRATWAFEGRVLGVSYYSKQKIDAVAFVELLQKLVPVTNEIFRHVQLKRGE